MGWEVHTAKTAFAQFAEAWDQLNASLYDGHPLFDSRFMGPLLDHFGTGDERLCIHRTDAGISGALILCRGRIGGWSSFHPSQLQATPILLADATILETLFAALPGAPWTIELYAIDPRYAPDFSRLTLPQIVTAHAYTIGIQPAEQFTDYWNSRSRNLTKNVRRYFRRTQEEAPPGPLSSFCDTVDMGACVARYGALETTGWKGKAGTAIAAENKQGAFYREVLGRFAFTGHATVYELHLGGRLASSRLTISSDRMLVILKTAYDESMARFAPGRLLLYRLIEEQFALPGRKTIEFYTNATSDQQEWATFGCTLHNIQLFRRPLNAAIFAVSRACRQRLRGIRGEMPVEDSPTTGVASCRSIDDLRAEQYDLGEFTATDNVEASTNWFELLQNKVYPLDPGVRFYITAEKKRPRVILPLRLTTNGSARTIESLSNYYTALYAPLVARDGDLLDVQSLLTAAVHDHKGAQVMRFGPMDPDSHAYSALFSGLRANNWIPFRFFCFGNWFLRVEGTWDDYLKKRRATLRSSIRRACKKFAAEGGTLAIVTATEQVEQAIAEFQAIYSASWKKPEPYPEFVPSLIRHLAVRGMLRLGFARLGEQTIAAQLWIVGGRKASIYKVAYHEHFSAYSPGTLLTAHLMQHVIESDKVEEVDYLIGDDEYKRRWMSDRRERWGIVAYNPASLLGFALLIKEVGGRALKPTYRRMRAFCRRVWTRISGPGPKEDG
jgi:CelD/BcsL family acetyltransferase involved in cellulose biosynthesis